MGFDVLYLPPIHPIGRDVPQGPEQRTAGEPGDAGSPWAIGAAEGGHTAIHPELGTLEDFRALVAAAAEHGIEIALDIAFQCSPDHPWVQRAPGVVPARGPDGYDPVRREPAEEVPGHLPVRLRDARTGRRCGQELEARRAASGSTQGVRIFRVDNPHTKAFAFWEWLIGDDQEATTRTCSSSPRRSRGRKVMYRLAKLGLHAVVHLLHLAQRASTSCTEYLTELTQTRGARVLPAELLAEHAGHPARVPAARRPAGVRHARLVLAATLSANYGIYGPAFELA